MFIGKINQNLLIIKTVREWADVEADQIDEEILEVIVQRQNDLLEIQEFLTKVYVPLRQTGAADVSNVEVPQCLEAALKPKSTSPSKKKASTSSTKKKATKSGSQKKQTDGDAASATTTE